MISVGVAAQDEAPTVEQLIAELEKTPNPSQPVVDRQLALLDKLLPQGDSPLRRHYWRIYCKEHDFVGQLEKGLAYAEQYLAKAQELGDSVSATDLRICRGSFYQALSKPSMAMGDYEQAVMEARAESNPRVLADALFSRGDLRSEQGDLANGITDLLESQRLYERLGLPYWARQNLLAIADAYRRVGDFDHAVDYYQQILQQMGGDTDLFMLANVYLGIGYTRQSQHRFLEALDSFNKSLDVYKRLPPEEVDAKKRLSALVKVNVADVYADFHNYDEALRIINEISPNIDRNRDALEWSLMTLAEARALTGKHHYAIALSRFNAAEPVIVKQDNPRYLAMLQEARASAYAAMGDFHAAFQELSQYNATHQRLDELAKENISLRMRIEFDSQRKEVDNRRLLAEREYKDKELEALQKARSWQIGVIFLGAVLLLLVAVLAWRQIWRARKLHVMAMTDELTRVANRRHIMLFGEDAIREAKLTQQSLSILVFDLDFFKRINDNFGHSVGDQVLVRVARASKSVLRQIDEVGRTGGEEFLVVVPRSRIDQAALVAERLRAAVEAIHLEDVAPGLSVSISVGVAELRSEDRDLRDLMRRADNALYRAKASGRNRVDLDVVAMEPE